MRAPPCRPRSWAAADVLAVHGASPSTTHTPLEPEVLPAACAAASAVGEVSDRSYRAGAPPLPIVTSAPYRPGGSSDLQVRRSPPSPWTGGWAWALVTIRPRLVSRPGGRDAPSLLGRHASVPFRYDVHALVFSEDAVSLENRLHHGLADRRLNRVNQRREFFYATPTEVKALLTEADGSVLEFVEEPEADEWHQSENARRRAGIMLPAAR